MKQDKKTMREHIIQKKDYHQTKSEEKTTTYTQIREGKT